MLAKQKLEYIEFSGGITDLTVPGKQSSYRRANNFLITRDKQLETRPGSDFFSADAPQLPGAIAFTDLIPWNAESELAVISGQSLFYLAPVPAWTELFGPDGGAAFVGNIDLSHVASMEWRGHLFLVPDGGAGPQKLYRDEAGAFQLRQAGLPKPAYGVSISSTTFLTNAIALALDLRSSMAAHYVDTTAHLVADSGHATTINALTSPTSLATLQTFVAALKTAYNSHLQDAVKNLYDGVNNPTIGVPTYHLDTQYDVAGIFQGRFSVLNCYASATLAAATDLASTAAILNDLRNVYNCHTYATITHKNGVVNSQTGGSGYGTAYTTNTTGFGLHACTSAPVTQTTAPLFDDQISTLIDYVNNLKGEFNGHLEFDGGHNNADTINIIVPADATDWLGCYILLAHLEFNYWFHYQDASADESGVQQLFQAFTATTADQINYTSSSINGASWVGAYFQNIYSTNPYVAWALSGVGPNGSKVVSGTGTTVVVSVATGLTGAGTFRLGTSHFHYDLDRGDSSVTSAYDVKSRAGSFDILQTSLALLQEEAVLFYSLLFSHQTVDWIAATVNGQTSYTNDPAAQTATRYNCHDASIFGGIPQNGVTVDGALLPSNLWQDYWNTPPTTGTVLYKFVYRYPYQVSQQGWGVPVPAGFSFDASSAISFEDDSTPSNAVQVEISPSREKADGTGLVYPTTLSNLPTLVNAPGENWDTSVIQIDVYRTALDELQYYLVGSVTNGMTTFSDGVNDEDLITNEPLYTNGGTVGNDLPPKSRFATLLNNTGYYGYITDITSGETFRSRVLQSIQYDIDSVPATAYVDLDEELTGLSSYNTYVLAFCKRNLYRLEGIFNELGQGAIIPQKVGDSFGAVNQASIVKTEDGVFYCGLSGILFTDGFNAQKVMVELERPYALLIQSEEQRKRIKGAYDPETRRIYWAFMSTPGGSAPDLIWILDLNFGLSHQMSFTTWAGQDLSPTALAFFQGDVLRGTSYGVLYRHNPVFYNDKFMDPAEDPSDWGYQPVLWDFESCATNFGSSQMKKWVTRITVQGQNRSNLHLAIEHRNNNGSGLYKRLQPIAFERNVLWGDTEPIWGDDACVWFDDGMLDSFRRFTAGDLRCDWKSVRFFNDPAGAIYFEDLPGFTGTVGPALIYHASDTASEAFIIAPTLTSTEKQLKTYVFGLASTNYAYRTITGAPDATNHLNLSQTPYKEFPSPNTVFFDGFLVNTATPYLPAGWGRATASPSAITADGFHQFHGGYAEYLGSGTDPTFLRDAGTVKMIVTLGFSGFPPDPSKDYLFFHSSLASNQSEALAEFSLWYSQSGNLVATLGSTDGLTTAQCSADFTGYASINNKLYIELRFQASNGLIEVYINGVLFMATTSGAAINRSTAVIEYIALGNTELLNHGFGTATYRSLEILSVYDAREAYRIAGPALSERFNLTAYNMNFAWLSDEQGAYQGAGT